MHKIWAGQSGPKCRIGNSYGPWHCLFQRVRQFGRIGVEPGLRPWGDGHGRGVSGVWALVGPGLCQRGRVSAGVGTTIVNGPIRPGHWLCLGNIAKQAVSARKPTSKRRCSSRSFDRVDPLAANHSWSQIPRKIAYSTFGCIRCNCVSIKAKWRQNMKVNEV